MTVQSEAAYIGFHQANDVDLSFEAENDVKLAFDCKKYTGKRFEVIFNPGLSIGSKRSLNAYGSKPSKRY